MHVLAEKFTGIEGVNRACTERQIEQKETQDRKGFAGPVKTARNYRPHVGAEKHHVLWHLVQSDSKVLSQLASKGQQTSAWLVNL